MLVLLKLTLAEDARQIQVPGLFVVVLVTEMDAGPQTPPVRENVAIGLLLSTIVLLVLSEQPLFVVTIN